ncbi:hypothetical protein MCEMSEM47_01525 [Burkholderiales bacterium]
MNRIFSLSLCLTLLSAAFTPSPARANLYLMLDKASGRVSYAEMYSIRRTTEGALVWRIEDRRHPDLMGHLSTLYLEELDCAGQRARTRLERRYSGKQATGRPTRVVKVNSNWRPVRGENGPDGILLGSICPLVKK